jgi:hypothetical protein
MTRMLLQEYSVLSSKKYGRVLCSILNDSDPYAYLTIYVVLDV